MERGTVTGQPEQRIREVRRAEAEYQQLIHRARGGELVLSLLLRVLLAVVFFVSCALMVCYVVIPQYGWAVGTAGLPGRFEVHSCYKDPSYTGPRKYTPTICTGVLKALDGRVLDLAAHTDGLNGERAGKTSDVRYTDVDEIHLTGTRPVIQEFSAFILALALAASGITVLLLAFRRLSPTYSWFTRDTRVRRWPSRLATFGGPGFAAAAVATYLISLAF